MSIAQRIQLIIKYYNMSYNSFAKSLGLANGSGIKTMIDNNRNPQNQTLNKIVNTYPDIDMNWLRTGSGKMINNLPESMSDNDDLTVTAKQVIKQLDINKLHYTALLDKKFMQKKADNRTLAELSNKQLTYIERLSLETFNLEKSLWKIVKSSDDIDIKNKIITQIEKLSEINGSFIQVIMRNRK